MGELTRTTPKPLLRVGEDTLLDLTLGLFRSAGEMPAVVNAHYLGEQVEQHCAGMDDVVVSSEQELLETGGGLKAAQEHFASGPVVTANSDVVFSVGENPVAGLRSEWRDGIGAVLLVTPRAQVRGHQGAGDFFMAPDGQLVRRGDAAEAPYVYTGIQVIDPSWVVVEESDVFSFNLIWDRMILAGTLYGRIHDGSWVDTGTPEGLAIARELRGV